MKDADKTKAQLIAELAQFRALVSEAGLDSRDPANVPHQRPPLPIDSFERRYLDLIQRNRDGYALLDMDGGFVLCNPAYRQMLGYAEEELRECTYADITPEEWHAADETGLQQMLQLGHCDLYEKEYRRKDGTLFPVEIQSYLIRDSDGGPTGMWSFVRDITERKETDQSLHKANRALRMLSDCNRVVARSAEERSLLVEACRLVIEVGGYRLAWIGLAENDTRRTVRPVAQAGYGGGYLDTVDITWSDTERGRGPTGTAIRTGRPVACRDILSDPDYRPWRESARARGYASSIALPLVVDDATLGALNIYAEETDAFDAGEVELLVELADDLALGVSSLRHRAERRRAEEQVAALHDRFKKIAANVPGTIYQFCLRPDGTFFVPYASEGFRDIYELSPDDVKEDASPVFDLVHPEDRERVTWGVAESGEQLTPGHEENRVVRPSGGTIWVEGDSTPQKLEDGTIVWHGYMRDISARKQADEELNRAARQWQATFDAVEDGVALIEVDGTLLRCNRGMEQLFDEHQDKMVGRKCWEVVHGTSEPVEGCPGLRTRETLRRESMELARDGQWLEITVDPLLGPEGKLIGAVHVVSDITERKQAEAELARHREDLEEEVHERTRELRTIVNAMAGREVRMAELKDEIAGMRERVRELEGQASPDG